VLGGVREGAPSGRTRTSTLTAVNLRRVLVAAAVVLAAPVMSSCGVGFGAQTDQIYNPSAGTDDRSGAVDVLNALIVSGHDGSGTVIATLVNNNQTRPDRLTGITGTGPNSGVQVTPSGPTTIPANGLVNLAKQGSITITGKDVVPGRFLNLTFSFQHAASATLSTLVVSASDPQYSSVPLPQPSSSASTPASASPSGPASPSSPAATMSGKPPRATKTKSASQQ
jgi:hypothetical protein